MATIGHVHIKVKDLEAATDFYTRFVGLRIAESVGNSLVFLTAGKLHHDVALQHVGPYAPLPARRAVGLYHTAFEVPDKVAFAETYRDLIQNGVRVAATDHRISWALYLSEGVTDTFTKNMAGRTSVLNAFAIPASNVISYPCFTSLARP